MTTTTASAWPAGCGSTSAWREAATGSCARCAPRAGRPADPIHFQFQLQNRRQRAAAPRLPTAPVSDLYYDGRRARPRRSRRRRGSAQGAPSRPLLVRAGQRRFRRAAVARLGDVRPQRRRQPLHRPGDAPYRARHRRRARPARHDLAAAGIVEASYWVTGVGATVFARNGGGDPYFRDGEIAVSRLSPGCQIVQAAPTLAPPSAVARQEHGVWLAEALWRLILRRILSPR